MPLKQPIRNVVIILGLLLFIAGWVYLNYSKEAGFIYALLVLGSMLIYYNWSNISRWRIM